MNQFDDSVSLWLAVLKYRRSAMACASIVFVFACGWALLAEPVYRVSVTMVPNPESDAFGSSSMSRQVGSLAAIAGINLESGSDNRQIHIATLRSRAFAEEFIRNHDLLPILFSETWDAITNEWILEKDESPPSIRDAYRFFDRKIRSVEEDYVTGLIRLNIEWTDRELATIWANAIMADVNELLRQEAIEQTNSSMRFLELQLAEINILEIRGAIFGLIEEQVHRAMLANVRENFAFKVIDPAVVPDVEEFVRPNRVLILALALVLSPLIGIFLALFLSFLSGLREMAGAIGRIDVE